MGSKFSKWQRSRWRWRRWRWRWRSWWWKDLSCELLIKQISDIIIKQNIQAEEHHIGQQLEHMSSVQEQEQEWSGYFLYLYLYLDHAVLREAMKPAAEPNGEEGADNLLQVLVLELVQVQRLVQVEVQWRPVLDVVGVKQHTAVLNVEADGCIQEQVGA